MKHEWDKLSEAERAEFAAWREEKAKPAEVKQFRDMTPAERIAFARKNRLPMPRALPLVRTVTR